MLKKLILTAAAGTALVASSAFADEGRHRGWEHQRWEQHERWEHRHWHPSGYVVVNPGYYAPAPVYVAPPAPVYSVPAPAYYQPAPAYYPAPVYAQPSVSVRLRLPL